MCTWGLLQDAEEFYNSDSEQTRRMLQSYDREIESVSGQVGGHGRQ